MTQTLDLLERLIAFPTVSKDSNLALIDWAEAQLKATDFEVTRIAAPCGTKAGLFARMGPQVPGGICLSGHTDVVPVEGQDWSKPAFEMTRKSGRVFGRGTTDMKGFVASALALAQRAKGKALKEPLSLVLSYDEEVGCIGIRDMLPVLTPLLGKPRLVIVGEPTAMQVATGHKGKAALRVTCTGEPGHSALAPQFVNAIHVAAHFIAETRALQQTLAAGVQDDAYDIPYTTLHVGKIAGGRALNIIPDHATLDMEFRHLADVPAADLMAALQDAARLTSAAFEDRCTLGFETLFTYPGLATAPDSASISYGCTLAGSNETLKVAFGTEGGYFKELGLNTLVIGPGDMSRDGHKPDEGLSLDQLAKCDAMMDRVLAQLVG